MVEQGVRPNVLRARGQQTVTGSGPDIDFARIVPRLGSTTNAFEELCCQLARRTSSGVQRLHGAGGDGGIECFLDSHEGRVGWQAKYVFNVRSLMAQASKSLDEALRIHPTLTCFVLCFPFDLTGPTGRRGRSGVDKLATWVRERERGAHRRGRRLTIELWPAAKLRDLLLQDDPSGGMRLFFFGSTWLSDEWFADHLRGAFATAGPRYMPELNVDTDLRKWVAAFGREPSWAEATLSKSAPVHEALRRVSLVLRDRRGKTGAIWPEETLDQAILAVERVEHTLDSLKPARSVTPSDHEVATHRLSASAGELRTLEVALRRDVDAKHGPGSADSPAWRQWMAEYQASFPAEHLDSVAALAAAVESYADWLQSPECMLAFRHAFVLAGDPGTGKTHGMCDAAAARHDAGMRSCLVFGHQFAGEPSPWVRIAESLGMSGSLGADPLLDCLNAAGEATGHPLLFCIDALNETAPPTYWRDNLASVAEKVRSRPYLRLCVVCKTTFLTHCLPDRRNFPVVEHRGFAGIEREACRAYFGHFGLRSPIAPILQPELSNPLYLRLVCETLRSQGTDRLPPGWSGGGTDIVRQFLAYKASRFASDFDTAQVGVSTTCLMRIVQEIAATHATSLSWSVARSVIASDVANPDAALTWLVREALLIQDATGLVPWDQGSVLRPAFERLGDFLVATELLSRIASEDLADRNRLLKLLSPWLKDTASIRKYRGILGELSAILPERQPGTELPDLATDPECRRELMEVAFKAIPFRSQGSLTTATAELIRGAFGSPELALRAVDAVLSSVWRASPIDALWFHKFLSSIPMARRDAFWCRYLHERFEPGLVVRALITAAHELALDAIEPQIASRWAIAVLWFTAAADRRVRDTATRAATSLMAACPAIIRATCEAFTDINDDSVRERVLLSSYGALLLSMDVAAARETAISLHERYMRTPDDFQNAVIRDHIRCICQLNRQLSRKPSAQPSHEDVATTGASNWPLEFPNDEDIEAWADPIRFTPDEFFSDFFKYAMGCLSCWTYEVPKADMGKWIAKRVAIDLGYIGSGCEDYDAVMLGRHGGGRAKPVWAERIAKKYAWIAMYQLAARLHDHVVPRIESWEEQRGECPLILPRGRQLDPTLPPKPDDGDGHEAFWSFRPPVELGDGRHTEYGGWIAHGNVPTLKELMRPRRRGDDWLRRMVAYFRWDGAEKDSEPPPAYRQLWLSLQSFLVPVAHVKATYNDLRTRNLRDHWLPSAPHFLHGFAAEYPWGPAFDAVEVEDENLVPAWNEVIGEWEYDASRDNASVMVPAEALLDSALRWDGSGGFSEQAGDLAYTDPSYRGAGPSSLWADANALNARLRQKRLALLWTLHGEKLVMPPDVGPGRPVPRTVIGQVAYTDGAEEHVSRMAFLPD